MIFRFFSQPDSPHSQIFRKAGQKKAEPNIGMYAGDKGIRNILSNQSLSLAMTLKRLGLLP
jgi:hypothetical protein